MHPTIAWLAQGRIRVKGGDRLPRTVESRFGRVIRDRAVPSPQRHSRKTQGEGENFLSGAILRGRNRDGPFAGLGPFSIERLDPGAPGDGGRAARPADSDSGAGGVAVPGHGDGSAGPGGREGKGMRAGPWGPWSTLGFGLVIAGAFVGAQLAVGIVFSMVALTTGHDEILRDAEKLAHNGLFLAVATCGTAPVGIGLTWFFAWLRRGIPVSDYLGLKRVSARELLPWCLGLLALWAGSDGLSWFLGRPVVPEVVVSEYQSAGFIPLLWLAVVVLAPLNEEVFFRGFLFAGWSRSRLGGWGTVVLTSGLWALIHSQYDWYGRGTIFVVGLLLGFARLKTTSIVPTIVMHALMNLATTIEVEVLIRFAGGGVR